MIIALFGYKGSGKSTAARVLIEKHSFQRHSFADPLKRMLMVLGLTEEQLWGGLKEEPSELLGGKTPRHAMQTLGSNWGRRWIDEALWARAWESTLPQGDVVVDDLRFPNEAAILRRLDAILVKIERPGFEIPLEEAHDSEQYVEAIKPDHVLVNDGSLSSLKSHVSMLQARLGLKHS